MNRYGGKGNEQPVLVVSLVVESLPKPLYIVINGNAVCCIVDGFRYRIFLPQRGSLGFESRKQKTHI